MRETVLVIGASSDLALEMIQSLAEPSRQFILHYHQNKTAIDKTLTLLDDDQVLMTVQADLSKSEDIHRLIDSIPFHVHSLLFAQGKASYHLLSDSTEKEMDELYSIHVKSTMLITQSFLPQMIARRSGNIVILSSIWGELGASNESIYATMKGAQLAFMKSLAKEVGPSGIRVNAIAPGMIDTKMTGHLTETERNDWLKQVPLMRIGQPNDVAKLTRFLFSDESSYIHGQVIRLSGGL